MMNRIRLLLAVALLVPSLPAFGQTTFDPEAFHRWTERAVADWNATGLAVAVVSGPDLLFARGYGELALGGGEPVDADTLFAIGSTTKAMTAAALGILAEEGKLDWDDPVRRHIPEFRLADRYLTEEMTVRDLLTHRGGLPNTDLFWYGQATDINEMLARLPAVAPAYSMRSGFVYQNVMYAAAGEVVARVSGMPWADFVASRIFRPLGMERSTPLLSLTAWRDNVATPHHIVDGETVIIENASVDHVGAAGSVWSSVREMSRWLRMLLANGVAPDGTRILGEAVVEEMFRPQALVDRAGFYPSQQLTNPKWVTYGLGWFQQDYAGEAVDFHTGSIDGMAAIAGLIRSRGIGVLVLANRDHVEARHALMLHAFDRLLGREDGPDWSADLRRIYEALAETQREALAAFEAARIPGTSPGLPPAAYAGVYRDPVGGAIRVSESDGALFFDYGPGLRGPLTHWHHETFRVDWEKRWRGFAPVLFRLGVTGTPDRLIFGTTAFVRAP